MNDSDYFWSIVYLCVLVWNWVDVYFVTDCLHVSSHLMSTLSKFSKRGENIWEYVALSYLLYTCTPTEHYAIQNPVSQWCPELGAAPFWLQMYGQDRECNHAMYNGDCGWRRNNPRERERCGVHLLLSIVYCFKTMPKFSGNISTFSKLRCARTHLQKRMRKDAIKYITKIGAALYTQLLCHTWRFWWGSTIIHKQRQAIGR